MLRVLAEPYPATVGRCMYRVSDALKKYAPEGVSFTQNPREADLQILQSWCPDCTAFKYVPRYAVIYHAGIFNWENAASQMRLADEAVLVASWLPLTRASLAPKFMPMPLGADEEVFYPMASPKGYTALTTGYVAETEAIWEVYLAARQVGGDVAHVGGLGSPGGGFFRYENVSDDTMRQLYNSSRFVSALRRGEGYEMPGVEALFCGVRPIIFDRPDQDWFRPYSITIREGSFDTVYNQLVRVFSDEPEPISPEERAEIVGLLSWEAIARRFWARLLETI